MKNMFDLEVANEIQTRLAGLSPQSERQWGTMTVGQMLIHCNRGMRWPVGDQVPDRVPLPARMLGRLIKPMVLRGDQPFRRNSPTAKSLVVIDEGVFEEERERLSGLVERFASGGAAKCTREPHSFFGKMTPEEWAILTYKHLDHHLRQFGV
jgi:hypothetical protein